MLEVTALDATRTGTEAEDLANKLRSSRSGAGRGNSAYREGLSDLPRGTVPSLAGRSGISSFSVRPAQARRGSWRRRPSVCSGIGAR